jgi:hypothetical protein
MSAQEPSVPANSVSRKLAALALIVAAIGLPINNLVDYGTLVAAAITVLTGTISTEMRRWVAAVLVAVGIAAAHLLFPAPRIEEGHNAFLPAARDAASRSGLPTEVFRFMAEQFAAQYPPERRCDERARGCWRPDLSTSGYAFSADGIFDRASYSRRVTGIDFSDPVTLRLGFINELIYNWPQDSSDIKRFERDRRFWKIFDRFRVTFPFFVMYRFPAEFAGSALCWRGDVLWEQSDERFAIVRHPAMACRTLQADDTGRRIFAVSINRDAPLAMRLDATAGIHWRQAVATALTIAGTALILILLVRWQPRRMLLPITLVGCALVVIVIDDFQFIGGFRPLDGGDDGFTYEGYGRAIARDLLAGNIASALQGGERVYFFTPGLRYFRALERFLFGDTFLGYLSIMLVLPFLVFAIFRRFLPVRWALAFVLIFTATPLGVLFGSSFSLYAKWAARGFADPLSFAALLAGFLLILPRLDGRERDVPPAFCGAVLCAIAVFMRPNVVLATGVMLAGATLFALWDGRWRVAVALCLGFATILVSPLHNWVFGQSLVPFSDNVVRPETMRMLPSDYVAALAELLRLEIAGDHVRRAIRQLADWLSGASELRVLIPLHAAAILILLRVGLFGSVFGRWLQLTALATLAQHGIGLSYIMYARYHFVTWLLTCLVALTWLHREGVPLLDRAFPRWCERWSGQPLISRTGDTLVRLQHAFSL